MDKSEHGHLQVIEKFQSGLLLRDYSGRLTFEIFDVPGESYDIKKKELAKAFALKRWGFTIHGFDESFQSFRRGKQKISIEWDIWSGLTVVAKNIEAEELISDIISHFEIQAERNLRSPDNLLLQQCTRNSLMDQLNELSEYEHKSTVLGLFESIEHWYSAYQKACELSDGRLTAPIYSSEEIQVLEHMHQAHQELSHLLTQEKDSNLLASNEIKGLVKHASDVYFLLLKTWPLL